jgi:hypothetical protein
LRRNGRSVDATISDSQTYIQATFTQAATAAFAEKNGRDLIDLKGSIIAVTDYHLVSYSLAMLAPAVN